MTDSLTCLCAFVRAIPAKNARTVLGGFGTFPTGAIRRPEADQSFQPLTPCEFSMEPAVVIVWAQ